MALKGNAKLLRPGQIEVWYAQIDRPPEEIESFKELLSQEELARARRFRNSIDRQRYIARQGILREMLSQYLNCRPTEVEIHRDVNGKPYLSARMNLDNLQFSESDSNNMAAFAFSRSGRLGVDIEKIREFPDMLEIVDQHFTQREKQAIFFCPENKRLKLFYRFWTRKEAVLKAQGDGLLKALDSVDVAEGEGLGPWKVGVSGEAGVEEYSISDVVAPGPFAAAVAVAGPVVEISIQYYGIEEI